MEPTLGVDEVGVPVSVAKKAYQPFMVKELVRQGMPASKALKEVRDFSPNADNALKLVMDKRPILLNRAPSLHKHSVQAFKPVLMDGKSIKLNPLIVKGFNADFDGDTMAMHIPLSPEAQEEAWTMLPSKIIFKHGDKQLVPNVSQDYLLGVYFLSKNGEWTGKKFNSWREAKEQGLGYTDVFTMDGKKVTIGQVLLNSPLPDELKDYSRILDKKGVAKILEQVAKDYPKKFADVLNNYKDLGYMYSFKRGSTISLDDFAINRSYRDKILKKELPKIKPLKGVAKINALNNLTQKIQNAQDKSDVANNIYEMLDSGSFGKKDSARQILSLPGVMQDVKGNPIEVPVLTSYGEGLTTSDY